MSDVFLLTGCASGIGRHLAGALSGLGHKVLATDVNEGGLLEAAKGWKGENVKTFVLDVRDRARWEAALAVTLQHFGKLDVLLNIAGYLKPGKRAQARRKKN